MNVGVGIGMPYGGIGTKTILGPRNSGLMIGLGIFPGGIVGYEVGAQLAIQSFYLNAGYGISSVYKVNDEPIETVTCGNFMLGYMIKLNPKKTVFLDLSLGHTIGAPTVDIGPFRENQGGVTFAFGVGWRLAIKD